MLKGAEERVNTLLGNQVQLQSEIEKEQKVALLDLFRVLRNVISALLLQPL